RPSTQQPPTSPAHDRFTAPFAGRLRTGATHPQRRTIIRQPRQPIPATTTSTASHRRRSHMDDRTAMINRMLIYVNQLDPLVRNTDLHAAKRVIIDYYGSVDPAKREPITPGYIRRQARRIETSHNRDAVMCAEHDWNHATTCAECKSEIAAGEREPSQQGQKV